MIPMHVYVREWVTVSSAFLAPWMLLIFLANIAIYVKTNGWHWHRSDWTDASTALATFKLGFFMRSAWVGALLWMYIHYGNSHGVEDWWSIDAIGGVFQNIGGLCVIRIFTPREWGKARFFWRPWVMATNTMAIGTCIVNGWPIDFWH